MENTNKTAGKTATESIGVTEMQHKDRTYGDEIKEAKDKLLEVYHILKKYGNPNARSVTITSGKMQVWVAQRTLEEVQEEIDKMEQCDEERQAYDELVQEVK